MERVMNGTTASTIFQTYGTVQLGADLTRVAWPQLKQQFNCHSNQSIESLPKRPNTTEVGDPGRVSHTLLSMFPVDLLMVGCDEDGPARELGYHLCRKPPLSTRPKMVVEAWGEHEL
jgi:hypothetical protein